MSYSKRVYEQAMSELERRRDNAVYEQRKRYEEAVQKIPELIETEREMADTAMSVVKALGRGEDVSSFIETLSERNLAAQKRREELLVQAGFPKDYLKTKYTCPVCDDKGFVAGKRCECHKMLVRSIAYKSLCENLPIERSGFENFSLDFYPRKPDRDGFSPYERMSEIYRFCRDYASDFGKDSPNLFMQGATGLGKTHLSRAIAKSAVEKGYGVIYGSAQNLLNRVEKEHFGRAERDEETLESLLECDLLILDDLGTEFSTSFTQSCIYNIVNTRILKGIPTVISTNLSMEELEQKYTQRITSRIIGSYISLDFCGKDIRQIKADY